MNYYTCQNPNILKYFTLYSASEKYKWEFARKITFFKMSCFSITEFTVYKIFFTNFHWLNTSQIAYLMQAKYTDMGEKNYIFWYYINDYFKGWLHKTFTAPTMKVHHYWGSSV